MTEDAIIALLYAACACARRQDWCGYRCHMDEAKTALAQCPENDALWGEYLMAEAIDCGRDLTRLHSRLSKAQARLGGRSRLFGNTPQLFGDYYNVFSICNVTPGHADENAAVLAQLVPLFHGLTGGGEGTDICYRAQLAYFRGELETALPLARQALDIAQRTAQPLVALCAADTLTGIAKHRQDVALWRFAGSYIDMAAARSGEEARPSREQAQLLRCVQDLSLGFLHSVPSWVIRGESGMIPTPWGYEAVDDRLLCGTFPHALIVKLQYESYCGEPVRALQTAALMQDVYGMRDVVQDAYLALFRAGCYLQLGDSRRVAQSLDEAVAALAPDGLWLIAAEFAPAFTQALYDAAARVSPTGAQRIQALGADYWQKLTLFRAEILRGTSAGLTRREQQVSDLLLQGCTNAQIAARLSICERTVKSHITSIFGKYNIYRRSQLADAVQGTRVARLADWTR